MTDPLMTQALAALVRGDNLFTGHDAGGGVGGAPAQLRTRSGEISRVVAVPGLPGQSGIRSGRSVAALHRLADADRALSQILTAARADRAHASTASRAILRAARADMLPGADTPVGRREAIARMVARLRAQHGYVVRTRSRARLLTLRLRRLRYLRLHGHHHHLAAAGSGGGRPAVLAAIRQALDIKGIHDPVARARWERGMDLVARRESNYNAAAENRWDSNAVRGTPSKGAWQFIEPTFAAYHEPGTSSSIHNLVAQACAFINYAQGRYGVAVDASNLADRIQQADPRRGPRGY